MIWHSKVPLEQAPKEQEGRQCYLFPSCLSYHFCLSNWSFR